MDTFIRDNKYFIIVMFLLIYLASIKYMNRYSNRNFIMPVQGIITQEFKGDTHHGIDIGCGVVPIHASNNGVVIFSGWKSDIYGYTIMIKHSEKIETLYAHNTSNLVKVGDKVKQGDIIAMAGNTGRSFGVHSHWEYRIGGVCFNPLDYVGKGDINQVAKDSELNFDPEKYLPSKIDGI